MSRRNGDRARFHKEQKRKVCHRQRLQKLLKAGQVLRSASVAPAPAATGDQSGNP
jgi:hypothetical protein